MEVLSVSYLSLFPLLLAINLLLILSVLTAIYIFIQSLATFSTSLGPIPKCAVGIQDQKIWVLGCSILNLVILEIVLPRIPYPAHLEVELAKRGTHVKFGQQKWGSSLAYFLNIFVVRNWGAWRFPGCLYSSPGTLAPGISSCPLALLMDSGPRSPILSGWGSSKAMASQRYLHKSPFAYLHQFLRFALPCPPMPVLEYCLVTPSLILKSSLGFFHN